MAGATFIVNAKDRACSTYYAGNRRFAHVSGRLPFCLLAVILVTLVHFGLYKFILQVGTEPVLTKSAFKRFMGEN